MSLSDYVILSICFCSLIVCGWSFVTLWRIHRELSDEVRTIRDIERKRKAWKPK